MLFRAPAWSPLLLAACIVEPTAEPSVPENHPANPKAARVPYRPPANPMKGEIAFPEPRASRPQLRAGRKYPLDICLVSGEKLGAMGDPVWIVHEGREIRFCCEACIQKFSRDPAPYLKTLDQASHEHGEK